MYTKSAQERSGALGDSLGVKCEKIEELRNRAVIFVVELGVFVAVFQRHNFTVSQSIECYLVTLSRTELGVFVDSSARNSGSFAVHNLADNS
jgi:hypothetical protein